jgi:hypothetical protein
MRVSDIDSSPGYDLKLPSISGYRVGVSARRLGRRRPGSSPGIRTVIIKGL